MKEILYGRHPKVVEFMKALGVPNIEGIKSFKLTGAVDDIVQMEIGYMIDANDLDSGTIHKNFAVIALEEESFEGMKITPLSQDEWPKTCIAG